MNNGTHSASHANDCLPIPGEARVNPPALIGRITHGGRLHTGATGFYRLSPQDAQLQLQPIVSGNPSARQGSYRWQAPSTDGVYALVETYGSLRHTDDIWTYFLVEDGAWFQFEGGRRAAEDYLCRTQACLE